MISVVRPAKTQPDNHYRLKPYIAIFAHPPYVIVCDIEYKYTRRDPIELMHYDVQISPSGLYPI